MASLERDVAAIDVGSNSVRLVIYRLEGRTVWTIYNEKVLAGLGRDLATTGRLSPDGVSEALVALKRFAAVIDGVQPQRVFTAATAAVREASDGAAFLEQVAQATGLTLRVLSGEQEAHYAAMGVLAGMTQVEGVVGDLGGASLELVRVTNGTVGHGITLPLGPFALAGRHNFDVERVRHQIAKRLKPADKFRADTFYAVGGAWRTLAQVRMEMDDAPLRIVHQYVMSAAQARDTARFIARQSKASLERFPTVSRKRVESLPYAALVLEGLIERLELKQIVLSAWGVREGLVHEALSPALMATDPLLAGTAALGGRQGLAENLSGALHAWICPIMAKVPPAFDEREEVLVRAACNLADVGARLHPTHRIELAFEQVLWAPIPAQTHAERAFLACAVNARYGGSSATPLPEAMDRLLGEPQRDRARILGLAIRLALDLSGRSAHLLANARPTLDDDNLILSAEAGYADVLLGEQTRRRAKALAEAMGRKLRIAA
jgi:Exopolyphosphatase